MSRAASSKKKKPPNFVVAIDPGEHAGIAMIDNDGFLVFSTPAAGDKWTTLSARLCQLIKEHGIVPEQMQYALGVIEQGWLGKGRGMKSGMTLSQRRGIAQAALESAGIQRIEYIHSSTWQNASYDTIHNKDTKEEAMKYVKEKFLHTPLTSDEAEAIVLAHYAYKEFIDGLYS